MSGTIDWLFAHAFYLFVTLPKDQNTGWWVSVLFGGVGVSIISFLLSALIKGLRFIFRSLQFIYSLLPLKAAKSQAQGEPAEPSPASTLKLISPTREEVAKVERSKYVHPSYGGSGPGGTSGWAQGNHQHGPWANHQSHYPGGGGNWADGSSHGSTYYRPADTWQSMPDQLYRGSPTSWASRLLTLLIVAISTAIWFYL